MYSLTKGARFKQQQHELRQSLHLMALSPRKLLSKCLLLSITGPELDAHRPTKIHSSWGVSGRKLNLRFAGPALTIREVASGDRCWVMGIGDEVLEDRAVPPKLSYRSQVLWGMLQCHQCWSKIQLSIWSRTRKGWGAILSLASGSSSPWASPDMLIPYLATKVQWIRTNWSVFTALGTDWTASSFSFS